MKTRWLLLSTALWFACGDADERRTQGSAAADAGPSAVMPSVTYDQAQGELEKVRYPGPLTPRGSTVACTGNHLVWREAGTTGAVHSWDARTKTQTDYGFKATHAALFVPSDSFIVVGGEEGTPEAGKIAAYRTGTPKTLVAALPDATGFAATNGAIIRADQKVDDTSLDGTKARLWTESSAETVDVSDVLPTRVPPVAFANDQLVIQGRRTPPSPLYIVDTKNRTTASVTFDKATLAREFLPTTEGLLVSYVRENNIMALRLYRNNQDTIETRLEIGDEIATRPQILANSPIDEHRFYRSMAMFGRVLLYASKFGIFAYDFESGDLAPVHLSGSLKTFAPDVLCVITEQKLLVFREMDDKEGRTWVIPLTAPANP